jgi:DNA polymerase I
VRQPQERRPLLVIDGDSFSHRADHPSPKSFRRKGDKPAGAILGFANFLLRLWCGYEQAEHPNCPARV